MTATLPRDIEKGVSPNQPIRRYLRRCRAWVERHPRVRWAYRLVVGVLGTLIAVVGLLLVPLPGPGWLIVFVGVAVLGTEFAAARRFSAFLKRMLMRFWDWWRTRRAASAGRAPNA
jgi:uncharacterized protein (TIGR02611 family)